MDEEKQASARGAAPNVNPRLRADGAPQASPSAAELARALRAGDRVALGRAITLVESRRPAHQAQARAVVEACLPHAGRSVRLGVTGVPGVGKSTLIEALGLRLVEQERRLAVLAIDPTSERSHGSILGDKTRMQRLAATPDAFIRPSPAAGTPGGVARATREAILLCEAAGFNTIIVETVGVGQAETTVHSMVDFFLLLALAGAGDELQGIKRGIVEMAHAIVITKADGANIEPAEAARTTYERALQLFTPATPDWTPPVFTCSARTDDGIEALWATVERYVAAAHASGRFDERRQAQARHWMYQTIEHRLRDDFFADETVQALLADTEAEVTEGRLSPFAAAQKLLDVYQGRER